jgi:GAF domain-containing protein
MVTASADVSASPQAVQQEAATTADSSDLKPAWCLFAAPVAVALGLAGLTVSLAADGPTPTQLIGVILVALWAAAGVALGVRRRQDRLGPIVLAVAIAGGAICLAEALVASERLDDAGDDLAAIALRLGLSMLPAFALHMFVALPDGRLSSRARQRAVVAGYVVGLAVGGMLSSDVDSITTWPIVGLWVIAITAGIYASSLRYRVAGAIERGRMQWIGWGLTVTAEGVFVMIALRLLTDWPHDPGTVSLAMTGLVPIAIIAGTLPKMVAHVDRLLTHTVAVAGLTALILGIYVIVVLGLGRTPEGSERTLLLLSMVAAAIAALLYLPARRWLTERANRLVYGVRVAPDETLRTFGQRLTRSIPLDELMLQLAENLRSSMRLASAEVWTGQDGRYGQTAGVPHRQPPPITIGPTELPVVARAGVSGGTWLDIWLPQLVGPSGSSAMRVAPVAHSGLLLGFIVVSRKPDGEPFTETEDTVLTEIARQIGLALHNVQLDTALQASLDELRVSNQELQNSRARIVAAGDSERRKLERNLHDGAQQHLVALAVKLRLAADAVEDDPEDAMAMIEEPNSAPWPTASSRRCSCRAGSTTRCPRQPDERPYRRPSTSSTSAATATTSRRPCTSARSRRSRTPASTPARTQPQRSWSWRPMACSASRSATTARDSTCRTALQPAGTASSTWLTVSAHSGAGWKLCRPSAGAPPSPAPSPCPDPESGPIGVAAGFPEATDHPRRQLVLVDVGDGPARAGPGGKVFGGVRRHEYHLDRRIVTGDDAGRLDPVEFTHVDVHQDELRRHRRTGVDRLFARCHLGDQFEPGDAGDDRPGGGAERWLVVDDHHRHAFGPLFGWLFVELFCHRDSLITSRAACHPHMPCTPPPGGVELEHR